MPQQIYRYLIGVQWNGANDSSKNGLTYILECGHTSNSSTIEQGGMVLCGICSAESDEYPNVNPFIQGFNKQD